MPEWIGEEINEYIKYERGLIFGKMLLCKGKGINDGQDANKKGFLQFCR